MSRALSWLAIAAGLGLAAVAHAGGQFVGDNGAQGMQRAGAFAARADDASALYYNPAGLAGLAAHACFGVNVVHMTQRYARAGAYREQPVYPEPQPGYVGDPYPTVEHAGVQPVPFFAVVVPLGKLGVGAGVFAPQGYPKREYPDEVMTVSGALAPAPQRYDTVSQTGGIALPSVAVGYPLGRRVRVGARASWGVAWVDSTKYVQGNPNAAEQPGNDTRVRVRARDLLAFTWGAGVHVALSPAWQLAATYAAPLAIDARGTAVTEMGELVRHPGDGVELAITPVPGCASPAAGDVGACIAFSLPRTATVALRWIGARTDLELDVRWEQWSAASDYAVTTDGVAVLSAEGEVLTERPLHTSVIRHNLDDVLSVRLGGSHAARRDLVVRAGLAYDTAAAAPSWSRLDLDGGARLLAAAGLGLDLTARTRLDLGAAYVYLPDRIVHDQPISDVSDPTLRVQPDVTVPLLTADAQPHHPFNAGTYHSRYLIASLGLTSTW